MGGPEKVDYSVHVIHFGGTEMVLGVRKWFLEVRKWFGGMEMVFK